MSFEPCQASVSVSVGGRAGQQKAPKPFAERGTKHTGGSGIYWMMADAVWVCQPTCRCSVRLAGRRMVKGHGHGGVQGCSAGIVAQSRAGAKRLSASAHQIVSVEARGSVSQTNRRSFSFLCPSLLACPVAPSSFFAPPTPVHFSPIHSAPIHPTP